jgi:hypothetical protein
MLQGHRSQRATNPAMRPATAAGDGNRLSKAAELRVVSKGL